MRSISERSLANAALFYLRRYSASRKQLAQVLERKAKRVLKEKGGDLAEARGLIAQVVSRMETAGYVDDARLAEAKRASLLRRGKGARAIRVALTQKGLPPEVVAGASRVSAEEEAEAAQALVRRRRLGRDPQRRQKDLAVLMRAGFGFDVAKRALQATVPT